MELVLYTCNILVVLSSINEVIKTESKNDVVFWVITGTVNFISFLRLGILIFDSIKGVI